MGSVDQTMGAPGRAVAVGQEQPRGSWVPRLWASGTGGREAQEEDDHVWGRAAARQEDNRRLPNFKMGGRSGLGSEVRAGAEKGQEEGAVLPGTKV